MADTRKYRLLPDESRIWAEVRATFQRLEVEATRFAGVFEIALEEGRIRPEVAPKGRFEIDVSGLSGPNRLFDMDLGKVLESRKYPKITGEPVEIAPGEREGEYAVRGELRMHGVASGVAGHVGVEHVDARRLRVRGRMDVELEAFRLSPRRLFVLKVDPVFRVHGDVLAETFT